ncbi:MAG: hypothetical protein HY718_20830, partial [Planctomycetes bacterium]|nr:hypothetical protein [Planctomycetota bacterium]
MRRDGLILAFGMAAMVAGAPAARAESPRTAAEWRFDEKVQWNGWTPGGTIQNVAFEADGVSFDGTGSDPIIVGPPFELKPATSQHWVVIDLECPGPGRGELFYTNKTTGQYGGFEPTWMALLNVPAAGRRELTVWPFWSSLGQIIRLRFDPPAGMRCRLRAIRVMELAGEPPAPAWQFGSQVDSWAGFYAATLARSADGLVVRASQPQAVIITPVRPFDASRRSLLQIMAQCPREQTIALYWATQEEPGLFGQPVAIDCGDCGKPAECDLRRFPQWRGTVTHLAIAFGTRGDELLTLKSLSIDENDEHRPYLRLRHLDFTRGMARPGKEAELRIVIEHGGGQALSAREVTLTGDKDTAIVTPRLAIPAIEPGGRVELRARVTPRKMGAAVLTLQLPNGREFTRALAVHEPVS